MICLKIFLAIIFPKKQINDMFKNIISNNVGKKTNK